jgi:sulfoxide reductase catalytic subunit YedY
MVDKTLEKEIAPRDVYLNRRTFLRAGLLSTTAAATAVVYRRLNRVELDTTETRPIRGLITAPHADGFWVDETITPPGVDPQLQQFLRVLGRQGRRVERGRGVQKTTGWQVSVGGLVHRPRAFDIDDLRKISPPEEHVCRIRCVEAW